MVLELPTNMATVTSSATTEVFVLNAKNYDRLAKKNPFTVKSLLSSICQVCNLRTLKTQILARTSYYQNLIIKSIKLYYIHFDGHMNSKRIDQTENISFKS